MTRPDSHYADLATEREAEGLTLLGYIEESNINYGRAAHIYIVDEEGFDDCTVAVYYKASDDSTGKPVVPEEVYSPNGTNMELTEEMVDAPRGFLLGLELGCKTLESMREHLDNCCYDYQCWPEWAKVGTGHITKAGKAILIYTMMQPRAVAVVTNSHE